MTAKLQNIILVASDVTAAERFYKEGLGLELKFRDGDKWAQMKAGSVNIALASPAEAPPTAAGATPVFEIEDLGATASRLTLLGAKVLQICEMGDHGRTAALLDPYGNLIQLFQRPVSARS